MTGPRGADVPSIVASGVSFILPSGDAVLADITLGVSGDRTGVVGVNGAGKSTLLRLLAGELSPGTGSVRREGRVGYLPQDAAAATGTVAAALGVDATLQALTRALSGTATATDLEVVAEHWELPERVAAVLTTVGLGGLSTDREVGTLSGGERTRVALARLLLGEPDVLLLDEPTNHMDGRGREALRRVLRAFAGGVVVVTHDRALLEDVDRVIELASGRAKVYGGNWATYQSCREAEQRATDEELQQAKAALRRTRRELQLVRERKARRDARGAASRVETNQSRLQLNYQREKAQGSVGRVEAQVTRALDASRERVEAAAARVDQRVPTSLGLPSSGLHQGALVVVARQVTWTPPDADHPVLLPTTLELRGPERVALTGENGSGKTTLLRIIMGIVAPSTGTVRTLDPARIAWLDQFATVLGTSGMLTDVVAARHGGRNPELAFHALARVGFPGEALARRIETLSGGERVRAALAAALMAPRPPQLLLLDEPTNHLDLDGIAAVERALREYDGAMIVVSHDPWFLEAIGVERVVHLGRGTSPA